MSEPPTQPQPDPSVANLPPLPAAPSMPRLVSRPLLLGWCLWLLVSWALNLAIDGPVAMPTVRWMLLSAVIGLMAIWPAWRLSLATPTWPTLSTLTDLFLLLAIFQVLIVRVSIDWPIDHAIVIDAAVVVYALTVGMLVDVGRRCGVVGRSLAMAGCIAVLVAPVWWIGDATDARQMVLSPLHAVWTLADPKTFVDAARMGRTLAIMAGIVVVVWAIAVRLLRRVPDDLPSPNN